MSGSHEGRSPVVLVNVTTSRLTSLRWTLQELLAPRDIVFLSKKWTTIGTKERLSFKISTITTIPGERLRSESRGRKQYCVAERMRWAAKRHTSREEDTAYCLLGLFGVSIPLLYGEGSQAAFLRLQIAIMQASRDHSLFIWQRSDLSSVENCTSYLPVLAASPFDFALRNLEQTFSTRSTSHPFQVTNKGLQLTLPIRRLRGSTNMYEAQLECDVLQPASATMPSIRKRAIVYLEHVFPHDNLFARLPNRINFTDHPIELRATKPDPIAMLSLFHSFENHPFLGFILDFLHFQPKWTLTSIYIAIDIFPPETLVDDEEELVIDLQDGFRGRLPPLKSSVMYASFLTWALLIPSHSGTWAMSAANFRWHEDFLQWTLLRPLNSGLMDMVLNDLEWRVLWFGLHLVCSIIISSWRPDHKFQLNILIGLMFVLTDMLLSTWIQRNVACIQNQQVLLAYKINNLCVKYLILKNRRPHKSGSPLYDSIDAVLFQIGLSIILLQVWQDRIYWQGVFAIVESGYILGLGCLAFIMLVPHCIEVLKCQPQWTRSRTSLSATDKLELTIRSIDNALAAGERFAR